MIRESAPGTSDLLTLLESLPPSGREELARRLRHGGGAAASGRSGGARLVAYVVGRSGHAPGEEELRRYLEERLPAPMVPGVFVALEALPRTPNGKVDRRALPPPEEASPGRRRRPYVAPRNAVEAELAGVWERVLGVEGVGIHDNFFELGGDSIRSIQVMAGCRDLGYDVSLQELTRRPTVAELAEELDRSRPPPARAGQDPEDDPDEPPSGAGAGNGGPPTAPPPGAPPGGARAAPLRDPPPSGQTAAPAPGAFALLAPADRNRLPPDVEDAYPLASLQAGMLFHGELDPASAVYHDVLSYHLRIPLDGAALRRALAEVAARHGALRTSFDLESFSEPLQLVHSRVTPPLEIEDLSALPPAEREARVAAVFEAERRDRFDRRRPPLYRFRVLDHGDGTVTLLWSCHHAVLDGWSAAVVLRDLFERYLASLDRTRLGVPRPPPPPYREFVALERAALASADQRRFWRARIEEMKLARLPRWPREAAPSAGHGPLETAAPAEVAAGLRELARREGVPLKSVLLAAHAAVLGALGGARQVTTGLVTHGRLEESGGEETVGLFLNTLPARLDLGASSWLDLVRHAFAVEQDLLPYRRYPLAELIRLGGGDPGAVAAAAPVPLFETAFNFIHFHVADGLRDVPGVEYLGDRFSSETDFTLAASFAIAGERLTLRLERNPGVVGEAHARAVLALYRRALASLARAPADPPLRDVGLSPAERHLLLVEVNDTRDGDVLPGGLLPYFERTAAASPDALALVHGRTRLSYGEVDARANRLARHLQSLGVGPEVRVGVCLDRVPEALVALLAVFKAGGAYLPLDPADPAERLAYVVEDAEVALLVTRSGLAGERLDGLATPLLLDAAAAAIARESPEPPAPPPDPDSLAYVIYTSGSTGRPKGVMVSHRALQSLVGEQRRSLRAGPGSRVAQVFAFSFDGSIYDFGLAWSTGAALCLLDESARLPGPTLVRRLNEEGVTHLGMTPSLLASLPEEELPGVRVVLVAGEACPLDLARRWAPGRRFVNGYGATETGVWGLAGPFADAGSAQGRPPAIGRPIVNATAYVVDDRLQPVPLQAPGELVMGGACIARGYRGQPRRTAERFVPDPFAARPGTRLYRTGDRAAAGVRGSLEFLGRFDHQVKVRGFRIELEEIEAALAAHPGVVEGAVKLAAGAAGPFLAAYAVPAAPGTDPDELRVFLRGRLPAHMVPAAIVLRRDLPRTAAGKVDRSALPDPERGAAAREVVAPRTETERAVAAVWAEVLGLEDVGATEDFFELGGHSLIATWMISRLRRALGVELPLQALFEAPTVASLAAAIDARRGGPAPPPLPPVEPRADTGPAPLSFAQERFWLLDRLDAGNPAYLVPVALRWRGPLEPRHLAASLAAVEGRHEVLRTVFSETPVGPRQVLRPPRPAALPVIDLRRLPRAVRETEARALPRAALRRPFDLGRGPAWWAAAVRLASDDHVLLLVFHHVATDGGSIRVMAGELAGLYAAGLTGATAPLPAPAVQYADYAVWQRNHVAPLLFEPQAEYWRRRLAGLPESLPLPTDRPRPPVPGTAGAGVPLRLPATTAGELQSLARRERATPFMVLLAAFQAVLGRWTGGTDVVVGSPVSGRRREELEPLIGLFVNTLVLRTSLDGEPDFRTLVGRARQTVLEAHAHQDLPFERLVEELAPRRDLSTTPLFQVLFTVAEPPREIAAPAGVTLEPLGFEAGTAAFSLTLSWLHAEDELAGLLQYATALFDRTTAERMAGNVARFLASAVADPDRRSDEIELLSSAERQQLVVEWGGSTRGPRLPELAHELVEVRARAAPDAVALDARSGSLTYGELEARADALALCLRRHGVGPEVLVGLATEHTPALVVGLLAVLKAGGAFLPLDPSYPEERLRFLLDDAGVGLVLVQRPLEESLPLAGRRRLLLDEGGRVAEEPAAALPPAGPDGARPEPGGGRLAYVIYTSGSTGRPKGVAVPHRGLVNLAAELAAAFRLGPGSRQLMLLSFAFDAALGDLLPPLASGATLVLVRRPAELVEASLDQACRRERITVLEIQPVLWRPWLLDLRRTGAGALPAALQTVVTGGETVAAAELATWFGLAAAPLRFVFLYGPTETTVCSAYFSAESSGPPPAGRRLPVGRPVVATRSHVVDGRLRPVPAGLNGELVVGGVGVARGYLGRPAATASRFVPDPFGGEPGARLYRTGDLARWLGAGGLEFIGRTDEQVKVRGLRIELGEIEEALASHPDVRDAAAALQAAPGGDRRLVAYLVPSGGRVPTPSELRAFLGRRLPAFMVPAHFVTLEALPLTTTRKVDRRALPSPAWRSADLEAAYVPPRTPVEEALAGIWAEVLGVQRVGVEDGFFDLGGHSLLATQIVSRLREAFGVEMALRTLFESPTVAGLARRLAEGAPAAGREEAPPPLEPAGGNAPRALSFAQQRLWFLDRFTPGDPVYNIPSVLRIEGELDIAAMERAFREIAARHEVLRTVFEESDGEPVQRVRPPGPVRLRRVDLRALPRQRADREGRRQAEAEIARRFDLATGPLLRIVLLALGPDAHLLVLTMHHVVSDGWSGRVLLRELVPLYDAHRRGTRPELPELPIQYGDFAAWQRRWLAGATLERRLEYWRRRLRDLPDVLELPTDRPRPPVPSGRGGIEVFSVPEATARGLEALGKRHGATLFMTLLAALDALLARYTGTSDLPVGTPVAGRTQLHTERLIGFFVNLLVLRVDLAGDPRFEEALGRVREATLGAYGHQEVPFEKLVQELRPRRDMSATPLFQVVLVLQQEEEELALPGLTLEPLRIENDASEFDLVVSLVRRSNGLEGWLKYGRDLFDATTMARLGRHLAVLLEAAAAEPARRLSELPLLTAAERHHLLEGNDTEAARLVADVPEAALREQAARSPDAAALVYAPPGARPEVLSYRGLLHRVEALALVLRRLGVGPEVRVGVCLERSPLLVTAVLAVIEAGGAYVPLDPSYPPERLALIVEDGGLALVLAGSREREALPPEGVRVIAPDAGEIAPGSTPPVPGPPATPPEAAAYVLYTSGSTGRPKGVVIARRAIASHLAMLREHLDLGPGDRLLQKTPAGFDASVWELLAPAGAGATLVVARPDEHRQVDELAETLVAQEVTVLQVVPTLFGLLARQAPFARARALRLVVSGGEVLPGELAGAFFAERRRLAAPARLVNLYGPTECTIQNTAWSCGPGDGAVPVGRPFPNNAVHVLDRSGRAVPIGVPGEVAIGGLQVGRGYLGLAAATAEAFVPDAWAAAPGARLYRTGDLGRLLAGGALEYLGRIDHQLKLRGHRIEPREIEAAILRHAQVRDAVVVAADLGPDDHRLVACVVPADGSGEDLGRQLLDSLRQSLPAHMVPAAVVIEEAIPLLPSGKADRRALALRVSERELGDPAGRRRRHRERRRRREADAPAETPYVAPATPTERLLADLFGELLNVGQAGAAHSFFELGGHSLLATQLVSRVRAAVGVELRLRTVFETPTLGALAARIDAARGDGDVPALPAIEPVDRGPDGLPLSFAQERLWFLDRLDPGTPAYNVPAAFRLLGVPSVPALAAALHEIVRRHEVLRSTFHPGDGGPRQRVHPPGRRGVPLVDLAALAAERRERELARLAAAAAAAGFDLARGPLLRWALVRLAAHDHALLLTAHHVVADGWSTGIFLRELSALYGAFRDGRPSPLPDLPFQYGDFAAWQRRSLAGGALERQLVYWRGRLEGLPALELPLDRPRQPLHAPRGDRLLHHLPRRLGSRLDTLSQRQGASRFMTLATAFLVVLGRYADQEDVAVGTPVANRNRVEIEGLIGFFVNTLVLRAGLDGDPTFAEALARVREAALGAFAHAELPFELLVADLEPRRDLARSPLFQVLFTLAGTPAPDGGLSGLEAAPLELDFHPAKFDLTVTVEESPEGWIGSFEYDRELFDRTTVQRLARHLEACLRGAAEEPGRRLSELGLLDRVERHQVLVEWPAAAVGAAEAHVLDHRLHPLPIGAAGELLVAAAGPVDGPAGRGAGEAALTALHQVPHPFATAAPGRRLRRTGERARRTSEGRVAPLPQGQPASAAQAADGAAAPAPDAGRPPRTPLEELLADLFAELLRTDRVDAGTDFFASGGHSLLATRLVSRLHSLTGIEVPLRHVFEAPTVAGLAARLTAASGPGRAGDPPPLVRTAAGRYPASFAQERLWFLDRLVPGNPAYLVPGAVELAGELSLPVLAASFAAVVRRHEVLRTTFRTVAGEPVQEVGPPVRPELPVLDLERLPPAHREVEVRRLAAAAARRRFDLATGPLYAFQVARLAERRHVLLLVFHHVVVDGWSLDLLIGEVARFYAAGLAGTTPALPELPVQYGDFAAWQRRWLAGAELDRHLAYWRESLAGAPPVLELPVDRPRPPVQTFRGSLRVRRLRPERAEDLRRLAHRHGATLFMVLLGAYGELLARACGQRDLTIGVPIANRTREELEGLVGFFVNTLAMRLDLAGEPTFDELLDRVRTVALGAYAHQHLPFERLVDELDVPRDLGRTPLFQVLFVLQNTPRRALELPSLTLRPLEGTGTTAKFDLTLRVDESSDGGLDLGLEHNADLFDATTAERMLGHLVRLLTDLAAGPGRPVSAATSLSPAERHQLVHELNDGPGPARELLPVVRRVEETARRAPDRIALVARPAEGRPTRWSYGELDRRSRRLAAVLARLGASRESPVALGLDRCPEMIVALLAAHRIGCPYLPLDLGYPAGRTAFMLADAAARVVVTRSDLAARLPSADGVAVVEIDRAPPPDRARPGDELGAPARSSDLAYLVYTSGSTGRPKGVAVEHRHLAAYAEALLARLALPEGSSFATVSTLATDLGNTAVFGSLASGGCLHVLSDDQVLDPELAAAYFEREPVDVLKIVPAHLAALLGAFRPERLLPRRWLVMGGDAAEPALVQRVAGLAPACRLLNHYGPTETTVGVATHAAAEPSNHRPLPLGRPLAGSQLHVLDARMRPVPLGVAGEICAGGANVARGYAGRPAATAAAFAPDPFAGAPGARLYRTGDRGRRLAGGEIAFLGRGDDQVKVRGHRVELGEVEAALSAHPAITDAAVVARPAPEGGLRLEAFAVAADEAPEAARLEAFLLARLPRHMLPAGIAFLPRLPLTPAGKVDRRNLPALRPAERGVRATGSPVTGVVAELVASLVGVAEVGGDDDFFALGGHSLLATRLTFRLQEALGVVLPVRAIFEHPTVAALAAAVEAVRRAGTPQPPPLERLPRGEGRVRDGFPLSFAQERLWFLAQLDAGSSAYHVATALAVGGRLDRTALARALSGLTRRHEVLRTTFVAGPEGPRQHVAAPAPVAVPVVDLGRLPAPAVRTETHRLLRDEATAPFDLATGPLLRLRLLHRGPEDHVLAITLHHVVSDGWSTSIFVRELTSLYAAEGAGPAGDPLPELPVQYADFAAWQRRWLTGEVLDRHLGFWRSRLPRDLPPLELPADRPRPRDPRFPMGSLPLTLGSEATGGLRRLARDHGATPFMALLAAFMTLLHRYSGQQDVVVGSPVANRQRPEIEGLIGFFVNVLVVHGRPAADSSFAAFLRSVRQEALEAYAHQDLPFEKLVEELQPERDLGSTPLFRVALVYQDLPQRTAAAVRVGGLTLEPMETGGEAGKFDLTLVLGEMPDGFRGRLEYNRALFDPTTAERLARHFVRLTGGAALGAERSLADLPLLGRAERQQLVEWNDTTRRPERGAAPPVYRRFVERAAERPEAVALAADGECWTYGGLRGWVASLAARLRREGVDAETPVAVAVERCPATVAAVLAVLEAGGVFVPLDPAQPPERAAHVLEDSGARVAVGRPGEGGAVPRPGLRWVDPATEARPAAGPAPPPVASSQAAYLLYTSGSTGRPKGVLVSHAALGNQIGWLVSRFDFGPDTRLVLKTPLSFDASLWELLVPLASGGVLVVAGVEDHRRVDRLAATAARHRATVLQAVPSLLNALAEEPGFGAVADLSHLVAGGEPLTVAVVERLRERLGDAAPPVLNFYGPTEATIQATWHEVGSDGAGPVPVGRPVDNTTAAVMDARLGPAALGTVGELCLGGMQLARGYHRRPGLTAASFVPDPAGRGDRLYRTGDLARRRRDGVLDLLGRWDSQVKVRGHRIELGEIEAQLLRHPAVAAAAAAVRTGAAGDSRIVAWIETAPGADGAELDRELGRFLAARLQAPMVPAVVVVAEALPRLPSGKLDRAGLPAAPDAALRPDVGGDPRTPTEEILASIWGELLGLSRVGVHETFFELGGHSLLATRLAAAVRRAFDVDLPLRRVFEEPSLAALAAGIDAQRRSGAPAEPALEKSVPRPPVLPLSYAQERLWFLERLQPGTPAYNVPAALRLGGALDLAALATALATIAGRHEVLRTRFPEIDGEPHQVVEPVGPPRLPVADVSSLPPERRAAAAEAAATRAARSPFDLAARPPLRALLLRLGPREHVFVVSAHHLVTDGWSTGIFVRELSALYGAARRGVPAALPELPVQYVDFALWQRRWLSGAVLEAHLEAWRRVLGEAPPPLALPTDHPRPHHQSLRGGIEEVALPADVTAELRRLGVRHGGSLYMALLTAFAAVLARYSGQDELTVGSPVANRARPEVQDLIGFFVNTLAIRIDLRDDPPWSEAFTRVRSAALAAYGRQDLPFEKLVEGLRPARDLGSTPLVQAMLVLDPARREVLDLAGLTIERFPLGTGAAKLDLTLSLAETGGGLRGGLEYDRNLFDRTTVRRLADRLARWTAAAVAAPDRRLSELVPFTARERQQLLEWNDTGEPAGTVSGPPLHRRIAARVADGGDAVAIEGEGESWSFAALEVRVAELADRLRRAGVGPEVRVAVAAERSVAAVVAVLAVLEAGGAFVPLDLDQPDERARRVLADSGARVVTGSRSHRRRLARLGALVVEAGPPPGGRRLPASDERPAPHPHPAAAAYVLFTSGSTGRPKGAVISHGALGNQIAWLVSRFGFGPGTRLLLKTSLAFDASLWELFVPLVGGGTLVVAGPQDHRRVDLLAATAVRHRATVLQAVPSFLAALVEEPSFGAVRDLSHLVSGGEELPASVARRVRDRLGTATPEILNFYGPTETTIQATWHAVRSANGRVPIGRPVDAVSVSLTDARLDPVPLGAAGELCIAGAQLARGYQGRPDLTAAAFVPDPAAGAVGGRLYRTGDLARRRGDGVLELLGRIDAQVKLRGHRIELGEIEARLLEHPEVRQAVAAVHAAPSGERRLAAYCVPAVAPEPPDGLAARLREHLAGRLPPVMVPSAIVVLEALPRLPSGKVDRRALPAPDVERAVGRGRAPRPGTEERLAAIWRELLDGRSVHAEESFFDAGGHSLLAVRLIARVRSTLGVELPLHAVFERPTLEALAAAIDERTAGSAVPRDGNGAGDSTLVRLVASGTGNPLFLVHPIYGTLFCYRDLARELGGRRPVYGLRARGLVDGEEPLADLTTMAAEHLRSVRELQPEGPYHLGGWSFGGLVAYEMARQLRAAGEPVATLTILDTVPPARWNGRSIREAELVPCLVRDLGGLYGRSVEPDRYRHPRGAARDDTLDGTLTAARDRGDLPAELSTSELARLYRVYAADTDASRSYRPEPCELPVHLFLASSRPALDRRAAIRRWRRLAGGAVDPMVIPGDHYSMLRSGPAGLLARELDRRLDLTTQDDGGG